MATVIENRLALVAHGYTPIPLTGKIPPFKSWQNVDNVTRAKLVAWGRNWPLAQNTGILTRLTPTLDVDILNRDAAVAVEELVGKRFAGHGSVLCRIGRAPKRAIPFRTGTPFAKIIVNLIANDGSAGEKVELLCDGQQIVVAGIHPDTNKPYTWPAGDIADLARDNLPEIDEVEARRLVEEIVELLWHNFGYTRAKDRPRKGNGAGNGAADWQHLTTAILAGADLHASTRDLAAKMVAGGMAGGAAVNMLRGLMESSAAPKDERWQARYDNIPRLVDGIEEKIARGQAAANPQPAPGGGAPPSPPPPSPPPSSSTGPSPSSAPGSSSPIEDTLKLFREWLLLENDTPVLAVLGTVAANMLPGDAVWLGIIAPPSSAKTEMLVTLAKVPQTELVGTVSVAGLLSGVPRRQQSAGAKGGLLQKIGSFGFLVLKDFGSILSMRAEPKAELLAALREVYDGAWTRVVGADGGRSLTWSGKIGLLFGCTRAYDSFYGVVSELGDRFLLCRLEPDANQFLHAMRNAHRATQMRSRLVEAVADLFATPLPAPRDIGAREVLWLNTILLVAVRLRGAVKRDYRTRELEDIYGAEGPARFGKALERVLAGLDCLGVGRRKARRVVRAMAFDSVPPNRLSVYRHLKSLKGQPANTTAIAGAVKLPTVTTHRVLEELVAYGLVRRKSQGPGRADLWRAE